MVCVPGGDGDDLLDLEHELEVLTARQSLLSAQLQQVANRFTELQSVVTLYHALGGGRETETAQ